MRYDEFRDQLQDALHETGLFSKYVDRPTETIDLASADWRWLSVFAIVDGGLVEVVEGLSSGESSGSRFRSR